MPTGAEIVADLNEAMESDSTTDNESEEAQEESQAEAKATEKQEDSSTAKGSKAKGKSGKSGSDIPYDRFKEKVDQVADLTKKLEDLIANQESTTARETELREKIAAMEEDVNILDRVRELADHPVHGPTVKSLDNALKGIEEQVEEGTKTEKQADIDVNKLLKEHKDEITAVLDDQRTDFLLDQSRAISDGILDSLPKEYDDTDKYFIAKSVPDNVDWDAIEKDPSVMKQAIVEGYKATLTQYGEPRGALQAKLEALETKSGDEQDVESPLSDDEFVKGILENEDLGKMKTDDEGKVLGPVVSDDEFENQFADMLRRRNLS
jgi:hypothetical protein